MLKVEWYREYALDNGFGEVELVGRFNKDTNHLVLVKGLRDKIKVTIPPKKGSWEKHFFYLIKETERNGILVMKNGVVKNNTHRPISVDDFRGFCIADSLAPLIFINNNDAKSAQMFTLIHELAHLMIGESAIIDLYHKTKSKEEELCNAVAAEFLVPGAIFKEEWALLNKSNF